jgi:hypothetical protein
MRLAVCGYAARPSTAEILVEAVPAPFKNRVASGGKIFLFVIFGNDILK